jgi:hypothetical protein
VYFNIIIPTASRSSKWSISSKLPTRNSVLISYIAMPRLCSTVHSLVTYSNSCSGARGSEVNRYSFVIEVLCVFWVLRIHFADTM